MDKILTLGIETSCDEAAAAVLRGEYSDKFLYCEVR